MLDLSVLTKEDFKKLRNSNIVEDTAPLYDRLKPYLDLRLKIRLSYKTLTTPPLYSMDLINEEIDALYKEIQDKIDLVLLEEDNG